MKKKYILLLLMSIFLVGCDEHDLKTNFLKSSDFEYTRVYVKSDGTFSESTSEPPKNYVGVFVSITGFTDSGKNKEIIILPKKIEGLSVKQIGCRNHIFTRNYFISSDNLKRLYIPFHVEIIDRTLIRCKNLQTVCMLSRDREPQESTKVYTTSYYYHHDTEKHNTINYANVSFMYNYDTYIDDGYYWIDNYDYGSLITYMPYDPVRPGYTFGGWYKEKECLNKWDFTLDTLPEEILDVDGNVLYQETILYAKWINNE